MNYQNSWMLTCGACCLYPIAFHLLVVWLTKQKGRIDWKHIDWKFWRREQ